MAVFALLVLAVAAIVVCVRSRNAGKRHAYEAAAAADPLHPTIAAVLRTVPDWRSQRAADAAARSHTGRILEVLERHGESLLLVVHADDFPHQGLLAITQGRTLFYGDGVPVEIPHVGATTRILSTGPNALPWVEIRGGGRTVSAGPRSVETAKLICAVIDLWADSPEVTPDPRVRIGPAGIEIDDAFYADTLRHAGHAVTPFNLRSIHERFGMQLHNKALRYIAANHGPAAEQRFLAAAGRPVDDRDLPGWPTRVMREWSSFDDGIGPVAAFFPLLIRSVLLDSARTGGYLARPERPLSMWKSDHYDDGGRGLRRAMPA
ncbi:hypothetical protein [Actinomycetospora chiangmaiensis]|uniref:hypothetical protein n=1 Tax=Actinomycetospora chiangmaiensis TaxID=402650 RepID=UPI00037DDCB7|nr:hypothetical protein [Actinomycetospora chiangmaiensis]